jgi:molybdopterin-guanine dinucleotide biosynthesis protein A
MTDRVTAIVLAGGSAGAAFQAAAGVTNRAMAEILPGRTMLDLIVDALRGSRTTGRIVIVGDVTLNSGGETIDIAAPGDSLVDNIFRGLEAAGAREQDRVLLVGSDIPFIDPEAVDECVGNAIASGADFCYPIVPMAEYNRVYSRMKRTTVKAREGEFTGGNMILVRAGILTANPDAIRGAYAGRKSVTRIGKMLGWGLLLRIVVSQIAFPCLLTVPLLETAVGKVFGAGVTAKAIVVSHPSIGTDIDDPADIAIARELLGETAQQGSREKIES